MSNSDSGDFLSDLFREEVRTNCQILTEGLVASEQGGASPERLEAMMRAAHSIKGAARVVKVEQGVRVAHAMEDCFVRAQRSELQLTGDVIDSLLAGVDLLQAIGQAAGGAGFAVWASEHDVNVCQLVQRLEGIVQNGGVPAADSPKSIAPAEAVAPASDVAASTQSDGEPAKAAAATTEAVVRVTARSLTRLMGLAGESLVESRWLQPFSKSLLRLRRMHADFAEMLDNLDEAIQSGAARDTSASMLSEMRERLGACREILAERITEFDRRTRDADDLSSRLYREVISSRMRPFRDGVQGLPRLVRDLARQLGKKAQFEICGETTEVDRDILESLDAPLTHLVRNALDHGLETPAERQAAGKPEIGRIRIEASHTAGLLAITVSDDGRGIDVEQLRRKVVDRGLTNHDVAEKLGEVELLDFLFLPGFSTAAEVSEISGRGVGLDVVHTMVQSAGGHVRVSTRNGIETSFQLRLPVTLSVLRAVVVDIAGEPYAFPHNRIDRLIRVPRKDLRSVENRQYFEIDGENVGIVMANQVLQLEANEESAEDLILVLFGDQGSRCGMVVDGIIGEQDLVVRPLDARLGKVPNLHAAAILDDGSPVVILSPEDLRRSIDRLIQGGRLQRACEGDSVGEERPPKRVLVVDDSITVREVERQLLVNRGYLVEVAVDGVDGWNLVREGQFDLVICDIDMPRLNGLELVRKIKADGRLRHLPVIIVSYKDRKEDRLAGLDAGANYYLTKSSFHDDTFVEAVRELIGNAET
jgi:two-component system, chemotaxis family, sensor histidine kinase and response regulator WspE